MTGQWALSYTGTIAFLISKDVKNPPKTFSDLLTGDYKVSIGEVGKATQSNIGVLAAAYALGGNETNLKPAIDLYAKLAEQKRLLPINVFPANMEKGEVQVAILWDFNALAYRDIAGKDKWDVLIPCRRLGDRRLYHHHQRLCAAAQYRQAGARIRLLRRGPDRLRPRLRAADPHRPDHACRPTPPRRYCPPRNMRRRS